MQILVAILVALVVLAFLSSRRAGTTALGLTCVVLVLLGAWTMYDEGRKEKLEDLIPVTDVEIAETRVRFGTTEYLVRNHHPARTLVRFTSERVARLEDGTIVDRRTFEHTVDVPPGQARWTPLRFPGLDASLEYSWDITHTVAAED